MWKEDYTYITRKSDCADMMLEKQDDVVGEIRGLREDLKAHMEERFERLEREIEVIKAKMGMV
jgi:hypothetical protein